MKVRTHKICIIIFLSLANTLLFGQNYTYLRIEDILKTKLMSYIGEQRNSESDTFKVYSYDIAEYNPSCLRTKITINYFDFPSQKVKEEFRDSTIYINGKPKFIFRFTRGVRESKMTFSISPDGKIDTTYLQYYDNSGNLSETNERTILYRNRFGEDSIYKRQIIYKGNWIDNGDFHQYIYDNNGRRVQYKLGSFLGDSIRVYQPSRNYNYFYTGNNLTLRVDSTISVLYPTIFLSS